MSKDHDHEADLSATEFEEHDAHGDGPMQDDAAPRDDDTLRAERDDYLNRLQRLRAEFENFQKRMQREKEEWREHILQSFMTDLLPLLDDFERAIAASRESEGESGFFQGVEMIHGQFQKYLESKGLEAIAVEGEPFDPAYCEAVMQQDSAEHPDKTVIQELRRGYKLGDRVVRPAQVILSRKPAGDQEAQES